jgi:hypothetical protein
MMIFVGTTVLKATVLVEASVIVGATVFKATVPVEIYGIIEATVLVGATVLGGRPREFG